MERHFLKRTVELADRSSGSCSPNPCVGAIVEKNGKILSEGYHRGAGTAHAEVMALDALGNEARGATLYVSLEPCCHFGRTPPCTERILESGVHRVIYGYPDPNPQVSGKGRERLMGGGIDCLQIDVPEVNHYYRPYRFWWRFGVPWTEVKLAVSLDGKTASTPERLRLTGDSIGQFTHSQRRQSDAILSTVATVLSDNPRFNVRIGECSSPKDVFLLDSRLRMPLQAQLWETAGSLTLFHQPGLDEDKIINLERRGARCIEVPEVGDGLCLTSVWKYLGRSGIHRLWVEAGATLFERLHRSNLVQRSLLYLAPKMAGNVNAFGFNASSDDYLKHATQVKWRVFGQDALCEMEWPCSQE